MSSKTCATCNKARGASLQCGLCNDPLCKSCAQIIEIDSFSFLEKVPDELRKGTYCPACFDQHVAGPMEEYNRTLEKAADVLVYFKTQSKETRLISRKEKVMKVQDCVDKDEAILRLAFFAVQKGFNSVIDIEVESEKVRNGGYQTLKWKASGIPANVDDSRIPKDRSIRQNPN